MVGNAPATCRISYRSNGSTDTVTCTTCELHAEAVFRVEGMDCTEEVVILERRLKPLTGLEAVSADLIGQRLHVKYDAAKLTTAAIVDAAGQTGMRMWLEHEEPASAEPHLSWRWRLMVACAVGPCCRRRLALSGRDTAAAVAFDSCSDRRAASSRRDGPSPRAGRGRSTSTR